MEILTRTVENLLTRAKFVPSTLNEADRTIDVVFVTETPVRTFDWNAYEVVDEILSCDPAHVRKERFEAGLPVLNNHQRYEGVKGQLGIVDNYRFEDGKGFATVRFSKRKDVEEVFQDVKDGIVRTVSVGYSVHKYEITKEEGKRPIYRAIDWEPLELSFAPVPADPGASVRNQNKNSQIVNNENQNKMELKAGALAVNLPETATLQEVERAEAEVKTRKDNELKEQARKEERQRSIDITESVRKAGLPVEFAEKLINSDNDVNKCRELIINEVADKNAHNVNGQNRSASVGTEQVVKVRAGMVEAITNRADPAQKMTDAGREFRNMSLFDMARFQLQQAGENVATMSRSQIAQDSIRAMGTSDFANVLAASVGKTLRAAYDYQTRTFTSFARKTTMPDFKPVTRTQISALVGDLEKIAEGGEYKHGKFTDGKETYSLAKYGKKIGITWEAIINDDLDAFSRVPQAFALAAANKQSDLVYAILSDNSNLSDGVALFHATHGNLGAAAAINVASMSLARAAMQKQKGPEGSFINVIPKFLICGPDKLTEAQQLINGTIVPTKNSDVNVFGGALQIISEARVSGNKWYLSAMPGAIDTIEYSFLDGEEELFIDQRPGFDTDGIEVKARLVFAAKAIDHRGLFYNPGA